MIVGLFVPGNVRGGGSLFDGFCFRVLDLETAFYVALGYWSLRKLLENLVIFFYLLLSDF